ncbi:MAG: DUF4173 domain-containing protein [Clostridiales bacterium]|nr:DUF4173 domain-containing protein [Clostridiales bacterium]
MEKQYKPHSSIHQEKHLNIDQEANVNYMGEESYKLETVSPLLKKVRENFNVFGSISIIFGGAFAFLFYKAGIGLNIFLFTLIMIGLLVLVMKGLSIPIKKSTVGYYVASALLGLSTMLTNHGGLQFLNVIGILFLLDLSLLHQFQEEEGFDFLRHFGRMFGLLFKSIASIGMPFADGISFLRKSKLIKNNRTISIILGCIIALPILFIVMALLSNADLLFGNITEKIFSFIFSPNIINVVLLFVFGFLACYAIICGAAKYGTRENVKARAKEDPVIAITVISLVTAVYILFCGIQIVYLFSNGLFVLPQEFTFAEYARRGFFELLAVTVINIVLIVISTALFREHKMLKASLTTMTICTYIMIASATYRMILYIDAYHLTFLRLIVLLFLLIDAFILAGVIVSVYRKGFPLFGYCVTVTAVFYIIFSFSRPDNFIATYHINNKEEITMEDIIFLTKELSYDAAPKVIPYFIDPVNWETASKNYEITNDWYNWNIPSKWDEYFEEYYQGIIDMNAERGIRNFNYSNYNAAKYVKRHVND